MSSMPGGQVLRKRLNFGTSELLFSLPDPIADEVKDGYELQRVFDRWRLVPYATFSRSTGQRLVDFYLMLAKLSPTHSACIEKSVTYAFGSKAQVVLVEDDDFATSQEVVVLSDVQSAAYRDAIRSTIDFNTNLRNFHHLLAWNLKSTGNAWVLMTSSEVASERKVSLRCLRQDKVLYINTKEGEMPMAAVSAMWSEEFLRNNPPLIVPLYPNFSEKDGVLYSLFHLKNGDYRWYGRPDSQGADIYKFREVQDALFQARESANGFTGKLIIEMEDDQQAPVLDEQGAADDNFNSFAERIIENFTNRGDDPMSVFLTTRPYGSKPMFVYQVKPNTSESWFKEMGKIAKAHIINAHGLTLRFLGEDVSNGFSADAYIADYVMNVEPVISDLRKTVLSFTNAIINAVWQLIGRQDLTQYALKFASPIESQVELYKNSRAQL